MGKGGPQRACDGVEAADTGGGIGAGGVSRWKYGIDRVGL
jgi:hypothetical protein